MLFRSKQSVSGTSKRVTMRSAERDDGTGSADAQGGNDGGKKGEADGGAGGGDDDKGHAAVDDVYAAAAVAVAQAAAADAAAAADEVPPGLTPSSDEYYPVVAIAALMRILRDPSLSSHHSVVIQAAMFIFKSLGLKCVPYLPQIMPQFLLVMRTCEPLFREFLFQQLGMLVAIVKQHIRQYLDEIFDLIHEHWNTPLLPQIKIGREHV